MYSYIKGVLTDMDEESIVVETGGIGYHIYTTGQTFRYLPSVGEEVKVYTYLHVREDAMLLFGFLTKDELKIYKLLLGVSGIGPKGALAILSVMTTDDLRFAVLGDDAKAIAKAPGGTKNEAVQALVALGYSSSEALRALNGIEITEETDVEEILKMALKNMAFL